MLSVVERMVLVIDALEKDLGKELLNTRDILCNWKDRKDGNIDMSGIGCKAWKPKDDVKEMEHRFGFVIRRCSSCVSYPDCSVMTLGNSKEK